MSIPRFYQNKPLSLGECVLDEASTHHMVHVLRLKLGAEAIIFNGNGGEFKGILRQIHKKSAVIELQQQYNVRNESPLALHLVQAISRKDHMDLTLQKAVELGVSEITPVVSDFSNIKQSSDQFHQKEQHWEKIIISATQQSGRAILTQLNPIISFREALKKVSAEQRLFLSPRATESCKEVLRTKPRSTALFIGCEGGFSPQEEQAATAAELKAITLGPRILRTETAAIAALSILQYCQGDF